MLKRLKTAIIVAGGTTARWVEWDRERGGYRTHAEIEAPAVHLHHGPAQTVFESHSPERHGGEPPSLALRRREGFGRAIATWISDAVAAGRIERLGLVADARLLHEVKKHLGAAASARLVLELAKNLAKTPDADLATWLEGPGARRPVRSERGEARF